MYETRGRKTIDAYVDGNLVMVKKPVKLGNGIAVILPKEWIDDVSAGKSIRYFLLDPRDNQIIIKPYFGDIPDIDSEDK